jgi:integrase
MVAESEADRILGVGMGRARTNRIEAHHGRFRVTWWVEKQRHRRSFATEVEARAFLRRLRQEDAARRRPARVVGGLTVMDVVQNWYRDHSRELASGTRRDYEGRIRRDVSRIGDIDANALARNPRELRAFYATLTPTNARRLHAILRQAFADAVLHDEVERNPCDAVRPRKPAAPEKRIPSPTEVEKLVVAADEEDPLWGLFLAVTATLGTRRGETCALRWEDVEPDASRVHVRRAVCKGVNGPTELKLPKNGRERTLLVGRPFFERVEPFRRPAGWMFGGREDATRPWHPDWPGHRFQRLARRLDMPYTLHSLRHFVATQLLARGLPVTQVAKFLGHRDPSVTMNLYGNHVVDDIQRAMGEAAASLLRQ